MLNNYLVFSDTHFKKKADKKLLSALIALVRAHENIIILGDFWDKYFLSFEEFIENRIYFPLFDALKAKNTIYLFGNHDPRELMDDRVYKFCKELKYTHEMKVGNKLFHFEHGDILAGVYELPTIMEWLDVFRVKVLKIPEYQVAKIDFVIFGIMEKFTNGRNLLGKKWNEIIYSKSKSLDILKNKILVCGHTHYHDEYDTYINIGANMYGYLQYMTIANGHAKLIQTRY